MAEEYKFNHFTPKLILKYFANQTGFDGKSPIYSIFTYDIQNDNINYQNIGDVFGEDYLYWDDSEADKTKLEKELNLKLEQKFNKVFLDKVLNCNEKVELTRAELFEIKRFILAELTRIPFVKTEKSGWEIDLKIPQGADVKDIDFMKTFYPGKKFKNHSNIDEKEKMIADLKVIVNNSFDKIINDENCSSELAKHYLLVQHAYIGFWKSDSQNDFIITDNYLINESDILLPLYKEGKRV